MKLQPVADGLWVVTKGGINVHALRNPDGETIALVDAGEASHAEELLRTLAPLGRVTDVVLTHAHYDHSGGAAAVMAEHGATVWARPEDAKLVREGRWGRPMTASPGLVGALMKRLIVDRAGPTIPPVAQVEAIEVCDPLPVAGGMTAHAMPGHSAGQVALEWTAPDGTRVLFAGDTCMNVMGLREPIAYEDRPTGLWSIRALAALAANARLVVFGHGNSIAQPEAALAKFAARFANDGSRRAGR